MSRYLNVEPASWTPCKTKARLRERVAAGTVEFRVFDTEGYGSTISATEAANLGLILSVVLPSSQNRETHATIKNGKVS